MNRYLIVSDLDDTLLGDDGALLAFADWHAARQGEIIVAYSSGRSCESILESMESTNLPDPVAIIGSVGTELRCYPFKARADTWPTVNAAKWSASRVRKALQSFPGLTPQADEFQSAYKVSYFLPRAFSQELCELAAVLKQHDLECELVYSSQRDLDVLPGGLNKGTAAQHVASLFDVPAEQTLVCGNSGNDAAMFRQGFHGVVVANAHPELIAAAPTAYIARQAFAAGVLEGVQYWLNMQAANSLA